MNNTLLRLAVFLVFLLTAKTAAAAVQPDGMLDEVAARFLAASSTWGATITGYASWLFWTLVVISMVWTFGLMALRRADIGEFFAEFIKLTLFTGFFWWLLTNGPGFAMSIIDSMRTIGATAAGLPRELTPSEPISIAFDIIVKAGESYSLTSPIDNLSSLSRWLFWPAWPLWRLTCFWRWSLPGSWPMPASLSLASAVPVGLRTLRSTTSEASSGLA
jgi:type IV secretory pathway TrbL component